MPGGRPRRSDSVLLPGETLESIGSTEYNIRWRRKCVVENGKSPWQLCCEEDPRFSYAHKLWKKYRLTLEQYDAMVLAQGGLCKICGRPERKLGVDHDHATGKVRGLLCDDDNLTLGRTKDSPARLRAAADYLEEASGGLR